MDVNKIFFLCARLPDGNTVAFNFVACSSLVVAVSFGFLMPVVILVKVTLLET